MSHSWCPDCNRKMQRVQLRSTMVLRCPKCGHCATVVKCERPSYRQVARWIVRDWWQKVAG